MSQPKTPVSANNPDNIIEDAKSLEIKDKVLARQKSSSMLNAISKAAMYIGGVLSTAAIGAGLKTIFDGTAAVAGKAALTTAAGAVTAHAGATVAAGGVFAAFGGAIGVALLVGTAIIAVGIITDYLQSRIWQSCTFDNLEANADSTARHLVKELKGNNMCLTNEQGTGACEQKKNWVASVGAKPQQQAEWAVRVEAGQQAATTGRA